MNFQSIVGAPIHPLQPFGEMRGPRQVMGPPSSLPLSHYNRAEYAPAYSNQPHSNLPSIRLPGQRLNDPYTTGGFGGRSASDGGGGQGYQGYGYTSNHGGYLSTRAARKHTVGSNSEHTITVDMKAVIKKPTRTTSDMLPVCHLFSSNHISNVCCEGLPLCDRCCQGLRRCQRTQGNRLPSLATQMEQPYQWVPSRNRGLHAIQQKLGGNTSQVQPRHQRCLRAIFPAQR